MHMPLSPIDRAYSYAIAPPVFAFRKFMAVDRYAEKQKSRLSWRIYRPSVVLAFFLYGLSNVLWFTLFGAGCLIAVLPVIAADWVGGLWLLAGIIWGMALRSNVRVLERAWANREVDHARNRPHSLCSLPPITDSVIKAKRREG